MASPFDAPIDLTTGDGRKLFQMGIKPLAPILEADGTNSLAWGNSFKNRVRLCIWRTLLMVSQAGALPDANNMVTTYHLVDRTSMVSLADVVADKDARDDAGDAQGLLKASMMYQCLYGSISADFQALIASDYDEIANDGPVLFKVIMNNLDTKATKQQIRLWKTELRTLKMETFEFNVKDLHTEVRQKILLLANVEETANDLAMSLIECYMGSPCQAFTDYVTSLENEADRTDTELNYKILMSQVQSKWASLVTGGKYHVVDPKDAQIVALQSRLETLEQAGSRKRQKTGTGSKTASVKQGNDDSKEAKKPFVRIPWTTVAPPKGEPMTKVVKGKTFHWCDKLHGKDQIPLWVAHKPETHTQEFKRGSPATESTGKQANVATAKCVTIDESAFSSDSNDDP